MAKNMNKSSKRLCLAIGVTIAITGCSLSDEINRAQVVQSQSPNKVETRFDENGATAGGYTAVVAQDGVSAPVAIAPNAPQLYTVVKGDTLWDISGRFLKDPWVWPQVWEANPGIQNPHLIYPGDQIKLAYDANGNPVLEVTRDGSVVSGFSSNSSTEKLSPRIRSESLANAIPTIPGEAIQQFLAYPKVVTAKQIRNAPYVIGNYDGRVISALGDEIYVRGKVNRDQPTYGIFRKSKKLVDPKTKEVLGHEVEHVSNARILQVDDVSTLRITSNKRETTAGDVLLSNNAAQISHHYVPRMPRISGDGHIVSLVDAITQSGRNQVVVVNLGERSGVQVGDVLAVERRGGTIRDKHTRTRRSFEEVNVPNTRTGVVMIFQTFEKVSYALVMESVRPIHINDVVTEI